jgi:hypothetical protein
MWQGGQRKLASQEAGPLSTNFPDDKEKRKEKVPYKFTIGAKVLKNSTP